ncbi:MAG TPA: transposase [Pirellulales bacterium]
MRRREINIESPELSDEQWAKLAEWLPDEPKSPRGGPNPVPNRAALEGILWVLRNGGRWRSLPRGYPSAATCWRRLNDWEEQGVWLEIWRGFLDSLEEQGRLKWDECFADASFAPAKKGAQESAKPRKARERSGWWWSMAKEYLWHVRSPAPRRRKSR